MLPAAALIFVSYRHVRSIQRNRNVEAAIHRDFQYMLAVAEKQISGKIFEMADEARDLFPSAKEAAEPERSKRLDMVLSQKPWLAHLFIQDAEKGFVIRSQPQQMSDLYFREEHQRLTDMFQGWFNMEGKLIFEGMRKRGRPDIHSDFTRRADGSAFMATVFFLLPQISSDRVVFGGASFDPAYLKQTFFPQVFNDIIAHQKSEYPDNKLALMLYPADDERADKFIAYTAGWGEGKPEDARKLEGGLRGLALGIKFEGTTPQAIAGRFAQQSFLILGVISLVMVGGVVLTYSRVSKELGLRWRLE
jgi:hypothetical protein